MYGSQQPRRGPPQTSRARGARRLRAEVHNKGGPRPKPRIFGSAWSSTGSTFSGPLSARTGETGRSLTPWKLSGPRGLKVGVGPLINSCGDPMTVRFQDYTLKKLGKTAVER